MQPWIFEQLSQQFQRFRLVAPFLDQHVEDLALTVDGPPHEHPLATDSNHHLVEMPDAVGFGTALAGVCSDHRTELVDPAPNGLVADVDASLGEQIFDMTKAQGEPVLEPNRVPDHIRWEPVSLKGNGFHACLSS